MGNCTQMAQYANGKRFRIGNDIGVEWALLDGDGEPYVLEGRDLRLSISDKLHKGVAVNEWSVNGNVISFTVYGKDQSVLGGYTAMLEENKGEIGMMTVDVVDMFYLVPHTDMAGGEDECSHLHTHSVSITSTVERGIKGDPGDSAYEVAVKNGFVGTEEEWLASLEADVTEENIENALGYAPVAPSDIANFITASADNLLYYYLKSETYSRQEVDSLISAIHNFSYVFVSVLPEPSADTMWKLYLVPLHDSVPQNTKGEYITIENNGTYSWELIGSTNIDLSNYVTIEDLEDVEASLVDMLNAALASYTTTADLTTLLAGKQDVINDLDAIRSGASAGATAYQKPGTGIPASDLASGVIPDVSSFITKSVNDLTNYYLKSETYTKAEVAALIGAIQQFHYEIYASRQEVVSPANNVLYLIGPTGSGADKYEEYVYDSTKQDPWVKIGDTSIDLSGYVTTSDLNTALANYVTSATLATTLADYWAKSEAVNINLADVAVTGDFNDLINKPEGSTPSSTTPLMDGTASVGTETAFARGDHRHPSDTSKQDVIADLADIRSGAGLGATAYQKPSNGIPANDMTQAVQDALDTAENIFIAEYGVTTNEAIKEALISGKNVFLSRYDFFSPLTNADEIASSGGYMEITPYFTRVWWSEWGTAPLKMTVYSVDTSDVWSEVDYSLQEKIDSSNKLPYSLISGTPSIPSNVVQYVAQSLTDAQKAQARTNIGAYSKPSGGIPDTDLAPGVIPEQVELTTSIINSLWEAAS